MRIKLAAGVAAIKRWLYATSCCSHFNQVLSVLPMIL